MLKVAQYAAQLENYPRAIEIYEQVSPHCLRFLRHWEADKNYAIRKYLFDSSSYFIEIHL